MSIRSEKVGSAMFLVDHVARFLSESRRGDSSDHEVNSGIPSCSRHWQGQSVIGQPWVICTAGPNLPNNSQPVTRSIIVTIQHTLTLTTWRCCIKSTLSWMREERWWGTSQQTIALLVCFLYKCAQIFLYILLMLKKKHNFSIAEFPLNKKWN